MQLTVVLSKEFWQIFIVYCIPFSCHWNITVRLNAADWNYEIIIAITISFSTEEICYSSECGNCRCSYSSEFGPFLAFSLSCLPGSVTQERVFVFHYYHYYFSDVMFQGSHSTWCWMKQHCTNKYTFKSFLHLGMVSVWSRESSL